MGEFRRGDKVTANYKGKGKWYRGKIAMVNRDGTFRVEYDDGDKELRVSARNVRKVRKGVRF